MFEWIVTGLALAVPVMTLLPLRQSTLWWVRAGEFARTQIAALTLATAVLYLLIVGWREIWDVAVISILAGCVTYQVIRIARYTPLFPAQLRAAADTDALDHRLSLMVSNVLMTNRNSGALIQVVRENSPDILLTLETDQWWQSKLDALDADYPYAVKHPLENLYGMHLYSRLELRDSEVRFLVEEEVPSIHTTAVLPCGREVALHCLHPAPPSPTENPTSAERDAELLLVARTLESRVKRGARQTDKRSVVVMGDLNDVAWSATTTLFQNLSGLLDPRIGRGMFSTFHARYPFLRWPLDHIFCSPDFTLVSISRLKDIGSDHFPIHAELQYAPEARPKNETLTASSRERDRADQKIGAVGADPTA